MLVLVLVLALAACSSEVEGFSVTPGSAVPGSGSASQGMTVGRVCLVTDLMSLSTCSNTAAGNVNVGLGSQRVLTRPDGTFQIATPANPNQLITVSGPGLVTSALQLGGTNFGFPNNIPALSANLFEQMLQANGIGLLPGAGSVVAPVLRRGIPVSGITATSVPTTASGPLFDGMTPTALTSNATGTRGVVWFPGVPTGPVNLTFSDLASSGETTVDGVQVVNGGITFLDSVVLP